MENGSKVIVLYDNTIYNVNNKSAESIKNIMLSGTAKFIDINGNIIAVKSISQIVDSGYYFKQHPEKEKSSMDKLYYIQSKNRIL